MLERCTQSIMDRLDSKDSPAGIGKQGHESHKRNQRRIMKKHRYREVKLVPRPALNCQEPIG